MSELILHINIRMYQQKSKTAYEEPIKAALENLATIKELKTNYSKLQEPLNLEITIIPINDEEETLNEIISIIKSQELPKGSYLTDSDSDKKLDLGDQEGLAIYLNGVDLPDEVYHTTDINFLINTCIELLKGLGKFRGFWEGPDDTALYFYGTSYTAIKAAISDFIAEYPLCQKCIVEQIA